MKYISNFLFVYKNFRNFLKKPLNLLVNNHLVTLIIIACIFLLVVEDFCEIWKRKKGDTCQLFPVWCRQVHSPTALAGGPNHWTIVYWNPSIERLIPLHGALLMCLLVPENINTYYWYTLHTYRLLFIKWVAKSLLLYCHVLVYFSF